MCFVDFLLYFGWDRSPFSAEFCRHACWVGLNPALCLDTRAKKMKISDISIPRVGSNPQTVARLLLIVDLTCPLYYGTSCNKTRQLIYSSTKMYFFIYLIAKIKKKCIKKINKSASRVLRVSRVKTLRSPLSAEFWVAALKAALSLA